MQVKVLLVRPKPGKYSLLFGIMIPTIGNANVWSKPHVTLF